MPAGVSYAPGFDGREGLLGGEKTKLFAAVPYEARVCATCGYAEWYASRSALGKPARFAEISGHVQVIEPASPDGQGPFR